MNPFDNDPLEPVIRDLLRDLPDGPAPDTLELRVRREIAARVPLPWWRRSYAAWPLLARVAFLVFSLAAAGLCVAPFFIRWEFFPSDVAEPVSRLRESAATVRAAVAPAGLRWLLAILAGGGLLYAALFGIGAAAYRLNSNPHPSDP